MVFRIFFYRVYNLYDFLRYFLWYINFLFFTASVFNVINAYDDVHFLSYWKIILKIQIFYLLFRNYT